MWYRFGDKNTRPQYKGEVENGKPNGLGVLIYPYNGKSIVGEWKNGKEWKTKHRTKNGSLILKFEMGKNGQVTFTSPDGTKYVGEFKYDKTWKGTFYDINGNIVIGSLMENRRKQ